ncbi:MAG: DUF1092 family protein [Coleofasciculaceae cyanobacterium SM2_1_6]|nr:DUF1092 family protein [Coleofasciculaceae cyanobacterium SM2_1_6]
MVQNFPPQEESIWQGDFYRRPLRDSQGQTLWELLLCDATGWRYQVACSQALASSDWVTAQMQRARDGQLPTVLEVFRPQSLGLLTLAGQALGLEVVPTRRTRELKQWLQELSITYPRLPNYTGEPYQPVTVDQLPPVPMPENLWGEQWRFASLTAGDLVREFVDRPLRIRDIPKNFLPLNLGLASSVAIPGIVIDGGRQSLQLARWIAASQPVSLDYIAGQPDGLILQAGLSDRWVMVTFDDPEVSQAARTYAVRQQLAKGLHFLLVQPDNSGMTYTGFWLLQKES